MHDSSQVLVAGPSRHPLLRAAPAAVDMTPSNLIFELTHYGSQLIQTEVLLYSFIARVFPIEEFDIVQFYGNMSSIQTPRKASRSPPGKSRSGTSVKGILEDGIWKCMVHSQFMNDSC
jgi:hypothetical protein